MMGAEKAKKLAILGMAAAAAMILSYVESLIPTGIQGFKIGLANIFTVGVLYLYGWRSAAAVSAVRCTLTALLFGSVLSFCYSAAGAALSLAVMTGLRRFDRFSHVGVSVCGGVAHNAAQTAVALFVTGVDEIAYLLPLLCVCGTVSGAFIGIATGIFIKRIEKAVK